jgi:Phosphotransferase enzyme family
MHPEPLPPMLAQSVHDLPTNGVLQGNLPHNPAVRAWSMARPEGRCPARVDILRQRVKSAIYRLHGVGPEGSDVIAKRCLSATALTERRIYQEILPSLPLPGLCCFGCIQDETPEFHWLFLEDAGSVEYDLSLPGHRAAAAQWLAQLHRRGASSAAAAGLPDRGPRFYLEQLRLARETIVKNYANPALQGPDLAAVKALEAQCEFVESRWAQVQKMCEGLPCTLVHSDIKANNVRIRDNAKGIALLPFDWELAGWGIPATDVLKCPDLELYGAEVATAWPGLTADRIRRLADLGRLFRAIITIYWNSLKLRFPWVEWSVIRLQLPQAALAEAIQLLRIR